jgi:hypothetical protein
MADLCANSLRWLDLDMRTNRRSACPDKNDAADSMIVAVVSDMQLSA